MKPVPLTAARICAFDLAPWNAAGAPDDVVQVADPAGVACFDGEHRSCRAEDLLRLDVAGLAEVRGDAGVLEDLGGRHELRLVRVRALEVELRRLDSGAAECALQERDVRGLVLGDDACELADLPAEATLADGLRVERRLEVLERQREVQDRDVAFRGTRRLRSRELRQGRRCRRSPCRHRCRPSAGRTRGCHRRPWTLSRGSRRRHPALPGSEAWTCKLLSRRRRNE